MSDGAADRLAGDQSDDRPSLWRNRDFRRLFGALFVTNAGDSLYTVATLWLVFELSGSTAVTGVANTLLLLPYLLQAVAGPVVDHLSVRRLLVASQLLQGAVVLVVPLAAATGRLSVPLLIAVVPVLSLLTVVVGPARTTLLPRILEDDQLARGNSALATVTLGLDMVFDALGGVFVAVAGATALYVADAATFGVAALLFAGVAVRPTTSTDQGSAGADDDAPLVRSALAEYVEDLRDGVAVLRGTLFVEMMAAAALSNFAVGVTLTVLPAFGATRGGPAVYGAMLGALGVGRLVGSATASSLGGVPYGRLTAGTYLVSAVLWVASAYAPTAAATVVLFGVAWVSAGANGVLTATLNQRVFPGDVLGRVSALKGTVSTATLPVGSLVGGYVAAVLGVTTTMGLAALGFGSVGLLYALRPSLRRLPATDAVEQSDLGVDVEAPPAATGPDD
jgi:hypothetical protein